ncbi:DUF4435 domain-containing protein [Cellulosilyticum ruminicola]|uniref:DUF4435 domain-containing protein n=1 Tax=Cellulosilyticum ruminicola TaxID=425254 RepID=UPI0006D12D33|nr:DUF4435 domain-containing protein [Cellulosilyticum ruminicola]
MKGYLNATRLITKLKMLRSGKKSKSFIVVEGVTDLRLYSKFVDESFCQIIIADSKQNVKACIEACNEEGIEGIIGIVDADFSHIERLDQEIPNLYLTDTHDLECMLLKSPAYEDIMKEYVNVNKYARFEGRMQDRVMHILLKNAAIIGYLRWCSLRENLGLNFSLLQFELFIDPQTLEVNIENFIKQVLIRSRKINAIEVKALANRINSLNLREEEMWQICCGHDLIEILAIGFVNIFGDYNAKNLFAGQLEGSFRLAYTKSYFRMTNLYKSLIEWQKNGNYVIFDKTLKVNVLEVSV